MLDKQLSIFGDVEPVVGTRPYGCIIADPPWISQRGGGKSKRGADSHYPLMPTSEIKKLRFPSSRSAVLLLWSTWNDLPDALEVINAWGFQYVAGFPWLKVNDGSISMGLGQYVRYCSEPVLIATKGDAKPLLEKAPLGLLVENEALIEPRLQHSRKPDSLYSIAELFPGPYLEIFARRRREGWDSFGNEITPAQS